MDVKLKIIFADNDGGGGGGFKRYNFYFQQKWNNSSKYPTQWFVMLN